MMQTTTTAAGNPPLSIAFAPSATLWLKLAIVYLMMGVGLGIFMGASENFTLKAVHAHLNLLGWTTLALAGLIYTAYPRAGRSRLARIHFWLHNLALPVMMGSLCMLLLGHPKVVPLLGISEIVAAAGVVVFAANVFMNVQPGQAIGSKRSA